MSESKTNPANLNQVVTKAATPAANAKKSAPQTAKANTTTTKPTQTTVAPTPTQVPAAPVQDELTLLKARADVMGVKYSPNIGLKGLKAKIAERTVAIDTMNNGGGLPVTEKSSEVALEAGAEETPLQTAQRIRSSLIAEQTRLIRCRVECMNPAKSDLKGEIFTTGNRFVGKISKFIPYGEDSDGGYHIPFMIFNLMKDRKFQKITRTKVKGTNKYINKRRLVPEFNLEVLKPLTKDELKEMSERQAAQSNIED